MPKDPDIKASKKSAKKSNILDKVKKSTTSRAKGKPKASGKKLSFQDKLSKIGVQSEPQKKKIVAIGVGALVALIVTIAVFGVFIYKYKSTSRAVKIASKIIPYPVASVNGNYFWNTSTYNQYLFALATFQKYYESQGQDLKSEESKARLAQVKNDIITQLEDNEIVRQQAAKYGIKVTNKEIQTQYDALVKEAGGAEKVKTTLEKLYGWSVADFKEEISKSILRQKLGDKVLADENLNASAKKLADDVKNQLNNGGDFAELAKKYSQDGSASGGGDLGLISKGQTVKEFEDAAFALQDGQVSAVVKTQFGFHIIKVTGREGDQIRVSHILIKGVDFDAWLRDQRAKSKIQQYFQP